MFKPNPDRSQLIAFDELHFHTILLFYMGKNIMVNGLMVKTF